MSSYIPTPTSLFQEGLKLVDGSLENVSLAADAVHRAYAPLPPVSSDFNENDPESFVSKTIDAIRAQVQRGLPITTTPLATIVSSAFCRRPDSGTDPFGFICRARS